MSNLNARIEGNHVDGTGPNRPGTGIGVSANTAATIRETGDVVSGNVVTNIRQDDGGNNAAIHILSPGNLVTNNHVTGPTPFGIVGDIILHTFTPVVGNTFTDNNAVGATFFDLQDWASDATATSTASKAAPAASSCTPTRGTGTPTALRASRAPPSAATK